ncbi:MAG TPA: agmatinase [Actinomycetota bacterium]|nr:agmatinase [Actinomycetota bacterium]
MSDGAERELGPFGGIATFAGRPYRPDPAGADVAVVGVPYDSATTFRSGARFGPRAIRVASQVLRPYNSALDALPFEALEVVDAGDVPVVPAYVEETQDRITTTVGRLLDAAGVVVALGGDHSVSLPLLRAQHRHRGPVALIHLDAHPDTWSDEFGMRYGHGTPFWHAAKEGLVDVATSIQIGMRGPTDAPDDLRRSRDLGYHMITGEEFWDLGVDGTLARIHEVVRGPVYLSVDIDVADPAYAPGTGTPEVGGMTSRQLVTLVRGLAGLDLVGMDLVEVAPPYDHGEITALLAANLVYEFLSVLAKGSPVAGGPPGGG